MTRRTRAGTAPPDYDLLIVGAGQAGVPLAIELAKKRWRVVLAERDRLGGSCVNFGCTPTKAVIASARVAHLARRGREFGIRIGRVEPDFAAVLDRARGIVNQSRIGLRESLRNGNVPVLEGHARFEGRARAGFVVKVAERTVVARRVVIDTGTRSRVPRVPGLADVDFLTAENWLDRPELPPRLAVLGAGYTGLEMAQFYRRMGSRVVVIEEKAEILEREDDDVAMAMRTLLESEDVGFRLERRLDRVRRSRGEPGLSLVVTGRRREELAASHVFVATGRTPNTDDLGLETIGLKPSAEGVLPVGRRLETPVRGVWAAGDVRGGAMFTHTAWDDFRVLLSQLAGDRSRTTDRIVPYAIYTDPQLGRVGLTERDARRQRRKVKIGRFELRSNGKAREIRETEGFVKVVTDARSGRVLGAAVLASEGAELVHLFVEIMNARAPASVIRDAIHIHPTLAEAVQSAVTAVR